MEFIFKDPEELNKERLAQGDVIARTDDVVQRLAQAHQYYADAPLYSHFVILTQSCDLAVRQGIFKAPYITIAAAKPFSETMSMFFNDNVKKVGGSDFMFHSQSLAAKAKQLVERHINNTESDFFFLPKSGHPNLPEDLVVFLRLTVALRKEHYDALAKSKIAELAEVFQAKLGWLTGNIYSRVATPDLEDRNLDSNKIKASYYEKYVPTNELVWLSSLQAELVRKIVAQRKKDLERDITNDEVIRIIETEIPEDSQIIANNIVERLKKNKLIQDTDQDTAQQFARVIANEPSFKTLVKSSKS